MEILRTENLVRNYKKSRNEEVKVLKDINLMIKEQEFVGVMGKSGCGKTTLLKVLGLIDEATGGKVYFKGQDTDELYGDMLAEIRRRKIGFVFQDFYLMNSLSVRENIILPLILDRANIKEMKEEVETYANIFGLTEILDKKPYELSGGEKQRAAICRAVIHNPELIFADEPTGNLDSKSRKTVIELMERINQKLGKTIVMVTHDPYMASYCSKVLLLKDGIILENMERGTDSREIFYGKVIQKMELL